MQEIISTAKETALFPLTINVLPGAYLPLQIFEPRYIDMVKDCLSKEKRFLYCLNQRRKRAFNAQGAAFSNGHLC